MAQSQALIVQENQQTETLCPKCQSHLIYRLGDGRHMCRRCRTKYTPTYHPGRLDQSMVLELASHFWSMTPINATAGLLGINRKTVQRYFGIIRKCIAKHCETQAEKAHMGRRLDAFFVGEWLLPELELEHKDTVTAFGMLTQERLVHLIFFRSWSDWSGLDLSSLRVQSPKTAPSHKGDAIAPPDTAQAFWGFARDKLRSYRGGFMKRFPVYLREMEFRYNYRHDPEAVWHIIKLLKVGPV